jgi:hypothetical protein
MKINLAVLGLLHLAFSVCKGVCEEQNEEANSAAHRNTQVAPKTNDFRPDILKDTPMPMEEA